MSPQNSFIENFGSEYNQEIIKKLWGFVLKDSDFPISIERYQEIINSDFCNSNLIFIKFNRFCPHIKLIEKKNNGGYNIKSPMVGTSIYNHNRNISYLDIFEKINSKYNRKKIFNICEHCCITIKELINNGNNIYEIRFNEETNYIENMEKYNNMLNKIVIDKDPFRDEIEENMYNLFKVFHIKEEFKFDSEAKYSFT